MPSSYVDAVRNYYEILKHVSQELWQFIWHGIWQFSAEVIASGWRERLSVVSPLPLCLRRAVGLSCRPSLCWREGLSFRQKYLVPSQPSLRDADERGGGCTGWCKAALTFILQRSSPPERIDGWAVCLCGRLPSSQREPSPGSDRCL